MNTKVYKDYLLLFFLGLVFTCWSLATPVGSSADDDYHLASIWCNSLDDCVQTKEGFSVPRIIAGTPTFCYLIWVDRKIEAYDKSAKCINDSNNFSTNIETRRLNQIENFYPNLFYKISSSQVGNDIEQSVRKIRLVWLFFFLANFFVWLKFTKIRGYIPSTLFILGSPLMFFLIPSTNPSSAVITSAIFVPLLLNLILNVEEKKRKIFLFLVITIDALIALGSRADAILSLSASIAIFYLLNKKRWQEIKHYLIALVTMIVSGFFTIGNYASTIEFTKSGTSTDGASNLFDIDLLVSNFLALPSHFAGYWGYYWGLGWKFEPWIPSIVPFTISILFLWHVKKFVSLHREMSKLLIFSVSFLIIAVLYFHQISSVYVGNMVQPRYSFPLFLTICTSLVDSRNQHSYGATKRLFHPVALYLSALGGIIVLYLQMLRVINGLSGDLTLSINDSSWWWQGTFVGPRFVFFLAVAGILGYISTAVSIEETPPKPRPTKKSEKLPK